MTAEPAKIDATLKKICIIIDFKFDIGDLRWKPGITADFRSTEVQKENLKPCKEETYQFSLCIYDS
jgi:hypothetical protein